MQDYLGPEVLRYQMCLSEVFLCAQELTSSPKISTGQLVISGLSINWLIVFCARCASCTLDVSMHNICARLYLFPQRAMHEQNCTYFSNTQYMRKICARLYLFPQCTIYAQDFTSFSNVQYVCKICARLYLFPQCAIYGQDCRHYWKKYVTYHISALNLECYSLHSYFWIATSSDFFLNKHL